MSLRKTARTSTDYGNRDITFRAVGDGMGISVPHDTKTKATSWAVEEESTSVPNAWDSSTSTYTVLESGYYDTSFQTYVSETTDEDLVYLLNEIEIDGNLASASGNGGNRGGEVNRDLYARADIQNKWLSKGQEIEFYTRQKNANGQTLTYGSSNSLDFISIAKRHSPQSIAASEKVFASYETMSGQSIAEASTDIIDYADSVEDSHGAVTTGASWKFAAVESGMYRVSPVVSLSTVAGRVNEDDIAKLYVYKNGSFFREIDTFEAKSSPSNAQTVNLQGSSLVKMNKGDYLDIRLNHQFTTSAQLSTGIGANYIDIEKL